MTLVRKRESRKPQKAEGTYAATITDVAERKAVATAYGVKDKIVITFEVDGETPIRKPYNDSLHPKSSLYGLIREVTGQEPPEEYDLEELIGKKCTVAVVHREDAAGNVWENIDRVKKGKREGVLGH
ncbi:MAG: hypothetical protein ACLPI9_00750 [Halobacteriota archaeon]